MVLRGPHGPGASEGVDTDEQAQQVPEGFYGIVWTNRIKHIAPLLLEGATAGR